MVLGIVGPASLIIVLGVFVGVFFIIKKSIKKMK